tara:strand:+ start:2463 stop:3470 length:1008 start_codon:yes stop_codon:yes gene_type:complete
LEKSPFTLHFGKGTDKIDIAGDVLRKMTGSQVLNLTQLDINATTNHSEGAQTLVIKNGCVDPRPLDTVQRHFHVSTDLNGETAVMGAHYVAGPGNHNKSSDPYKIHLRMDGPMSADEHHQNLMKQLKWSAHEGDDKEAIIAKSNIIEAEQGGVTRYAVSTDPADGPFPALLASKSEEKLQQMLPNSSVKKRVTISGKDHFVIEASDFHTGVDAFAAITKKQEVGTQGLSFHRAGDTSGDLIVQATLHREPHPECAPHDHLPGVRKGLKFEQIGDTMGKIHDASTPKEVQQSAAAAAIFGADVTVKDKAAAGGAATIVTGPFEDGGDEGEADDTAL